MDSPLGRRRSLPCQETLPSLCGPATPARDSGAESRRELAGAGRPGRDGHPLGCHHPGQSGPLPGTVSAGAGARAGLGQRAGPCQPKSGLAARLALSLAGKPLVLTDSQLGWTRSDHPAWLVPERDSDLENHPAGVTVQALSLPYSHCNPRPSSLKRSAPCRAATDSLVGGPRGSWKARVRSLRSVLEGAAPVGWDGKAMWFGQLQAGFSSSLEECWSSHPT